MAILKMKKLRAVVAASEEKHLVDSLTNLGCVQLEHLKEDKNAEYFTKLPDGQSRFSERKEKISAAMETLKPYAEKKKKSLFSEKRTVLKREFFSSKSIDSALEIAQQTDELTDELKVCQSEKKRAYTEEAEFLPWKDCDIPFDFGGGKNFSVIFGICPPDAEADKICGQINVGQLAARADMVSADANGKYIVLTSHKKDLQQAVKLLEEISFSALRADEKSGTARENIARIEQQIAKAEMKAAETESKLHGLATQTELLEQATDALSVGELKEKAEQDMLFTGKTAYFEGWLPDKAEDKVRQALTGCGCAFEFSDPAPSDKVPIRLISNSFTDPLNMVTEMYSLPSYDGIDPNGLILPFFTVFFGIMYADLGYGLILMLLAFIVKKKYKPQGTIGRMMGLVLMCGLTTAVFGVIFGGFFGDAIPVISETFFGARHEVWKLIDPMKDPITVLIFSIVMGAVQIIAGMAVKAYMYIRDGHPLDALFDVGSWWLLFAGAAVWAAGHGYWIALAGVAAILLTQGRDKPTIIGKIIGGFGGLYNIISYVSDALSYTRLMALLLATSVVASVINIIASISGNAIVFLIIFTVGHLFNMAVNIIGTYVHAARLQYLEFFSKFYKDGGKPFRPLEIKAKYVNVIKEEN